MKGSYGIKKLYRGAGRR